ncbi:MAG: GNAT family N-acetyltransferase [Burkholderiales bacterium]|nr:GNAT family N-acetyltransferase [Burkholderiales bacterium]
MNNPFRLEGNRVVLRDWRDSDLAEFARLNADAEARRYFPTVLTREASDLEAGRARQRAIDDGFTFWPVEIPGVTEFAGFTGLLRTSFEAHFTPCVEIGWRFLPAFWGKGYASEAARLALAYGFESLNLDEIVALTTVSNQPSRKVMERIGMTRTEEDDFDHPRIEAGHPLRRHVLYRLKRDDWLRQQAPNGA